MTTITELKVLLKEHDELELIERLEITSEEIVDRFDDKIEDNFEELLAQETGN
jgi:hypothetical protein